MFGVPIHQRFEKIVAMETFGNFPKKHLFWTPSFKYICKPSRCAKEHSAWEVHVRLKRGKGSIPKKFYACAEVWACDLILPIAKSKLILSFWIRAIYLIYNSLENKLELHVSNQSS